MCKMKTVKQVCETTGLNRKLLHLYDKEGIVKASGYSNNGHEGLVKKTGVKVNYDGYKLYDEEAVMKLQQIAIYEKLGVKRCEIKKRFTSNNRTTDLLEEQIQMLQQEKQKIDELLRVAEQLKMFGIKGELAKYYASMDFSVVANNAKHWDESRSMQVLADELEKSTDAFEIEAEDVLDELMTLSSEEYNNEKTQNILKELFAIVKKHFGFTGWIILVSMAIAADGAGDVFSEMATELGEDAVRNSSKAVLSYVKQDMAMLWDEYIEILARNYDSIYQSYETEGVKNMVDEVKKLLYLHTGLVREEEYEIFFEFMYQSLKTDGNDYIGFTLKAMDYYHNRAKEES